VLLKCIKLNDIINSIYEQSLRGIWAEHAEWGHSSLSLRDRLKKDFIACIASNTNKLNLYTYNNFNTVKMFDKMST